MRLLVVGSIAFDTVEGPTGPAVEALGGSAVHFSVAASFFTPVRLVGVVGEDFSGEHVGVLAERLVDLGGLERAAGKTMRWSGRYLEDMNTRETLSLALNVFGEFDPKVPEAFRDSELVFLANGPPAVQRGVLEQVRGRRFAVADTMDHWITGTPDELAALLGRVDGLVLNDEEARMLTGRPSLVAAGREVLARGPRVVIVKRGEHGATLITADDLFSLPAYPVASLVDPTGAGDAFAGGFMGYLAATGDLSGVSLRRALAYATAVASLNVEAFSVERLRGTLCREVAERVAHLREMTRF